MGDFPVMLKVAGRRCVIVGGGAVAARRARSLLDCGAAVTVIAPEADAALDGLAVERVERDFEAGDVGGAFLVVVATDEPTVNAAAAAAAQQAGALVNRSDEPAAGDVTVPAHAQHGPVTLAVETGGISASASAAIRRELSAALDADWPRLLSEAAPYRARLQAAMAPGAERQARLRRLTDEQAMNILKDQGDAALGAHLEAIVREVER